MRWKRRKGWIEDEREWKVENGGSGRRRIGKRSGPEETQARGARKER